MTGTGRDRSAPRGDVWTDADELRAAVGRLVRSVRQVDGFPANQAAVLGWVARDGALSIAELARREQVRHQSMARTVGLLQDAGLISVDAHPQDRRQVVVTATPAGRECLKRDRTARAAALVGAIERALPLAERSRVGAATELLNLLADAVEA
ncbi:MarR family transcriptional regulator [Lentzea sp. NPDC058450]|uniref:MarR family transcriptional regulator n=1 Tax=Lentzea sp. NPDC058450 TaxID=3346505 RepID=UPI003658699B